MQMQKNHWEWLKNLKGSTGEPTSEQDILPLAVNLWAGLQNEGETRLVGAEGTNVAVDPNTGTLKLQGLATDLINRYPFTVAFGPHGANATYSLGKPSALQNQVTPDYIATTLSGIVPSNLQPITASTFLPTAEQCVNSLATYDVSQLFGITLVSDTPYPTPSGVYQVLGTVLRFGSAFDRWNGRAPGSCSQRGDETVYLSVLLSRRR
jgi:hypothetical protein